MGASAGSRRTLEVGGHEVSVSNPDKVVFPAADGRPPITKIALVDYYRSVAEGARAPIVIPETDAGWTAAAHSSSYQL